MDLLKML